MRLPSGWETVAFSEITPPTAPIIYGILQPGPDRADGIPYVRPTEIKDDVIDLASIRRTSPEIADRYIRSTLKHDDTVLTIVGTIGKVAEVPLELEGANITQSSCRLRADREVIEPAFLRHFLRSPAARAQYDQKRLGTAVPRLNIADIRNFQIPIPALAEQRRIVAKLDALITRLARARAELDRALALKALATTCVLDQFASGKLIGAVDAEWPELRLDEIGQTSTGSTPPTHQKALYYGGDFPFVRPSDLDAGLEISTTETGLTTNGAAVARTAPACSVLVCCIGSIGKLSLVKRPVAFNQQINALVVDRTRALPKWVLYRLLAKDVQQAMWAASSATTISILNKSKFSALTVQVPSLEQQAKLISAIDVAFARADRLEAEAARARALIDRLEAAVLARAFRGELVPQDPADEPASAMLERIRTQRSASPSARRGRRPAHTIKA